MFPCSCFAEEGVEGVITTSDGLITGHLTIRLDAVLQAVQLPAGIAHLDSGLADVDRDALTLEGQRLWIYTMLHLDSYFVYTVDLVELDSVLCLTVQRHLAMEAHKSDHFLPLARISPLIVAAWGLPIVT